MPPKPGWQTSEFWITLVTSLPSLLVLLHLLPASDQTTLDRLISQIVAGIVAAVAVWKYIQSRTVVKSVGAPDPTAPTVLLPWQTPPSSPSPVSPATKGT